MHVHAVHSNVYVMSCTMNEASLLYMHMHVCSSWQRSMLANILSDGNFVGEYFSALLKITVTVRDLAALP